MEIDWVELAKIAVLRERLRFAREGIRRCDVFRESEIYVYLCQQAEEADEEYRGRAIVFFESLIKEIS